MCHLCLESILQIILGPLLNEIFSQFRQKSALHNCNSICLNYFCIIQIFLSSTHGVSREHLPPVYIVIVPSRQTKPLFSIYFSVLQNLPHICVKDGPVDFVILTHRCKGVLTNSQMQVCFCYFPGCKCVFVISPDATDMIFVQLFTHPDFQAKNFTKQVEVIRTIKTTTTTTIKSKLVF